MRIIICGYGKMGQKVEETVHKLSLPLAARVDPHHPQADFTELSSVPLKKGDVVIEFSDPSAILKNMEFYQRKGIAAVVGTTGLSEEEIRAQVTGSAAYLWSSNFSIAVHLFRKIVAYSSRLISSFEDYDIMITETHHKEKKDSPSGTALSLARDIIDNHPKKSTICHENLNRPIQSHELHVSALRGGFVVGHHAVNIEGRNDSIHLSHTAHSRDGFTVGAVKAAQWISLQKPGYYSINNFIDDMMKNS